MKPSIPVPAAALSPAPVASLAPLAAAAVSAAAPAVAANPFPVAAALDYGVLDDDERRGFWYRLGGILYWGLLGFGLLFPPLAALYGVLWLR